MIIEAIYEVVAYGEGGQAKPESQARSAATVAWRLIVFRGDAGGGLLAEADVEAEVAQVRVARDGSSVMVSAVVT
ncbi:hypothetical protein ABZ801_34195 [Actinomadura sp. NPDC047616]|uniref:hypothetical protein n=1 Tax=Actinomadura sp. NPDC047616 TaxID=3155914 RepID=UPI00340129B1